MAFRGMDDRSGSGGGLINLVLKPESNALWIRNRLRKGEGSTEVRFLPLFDENGAEEDVLNPDFVAAPGVNPDGALGAAFCKVHLIYLYRNGDHWLPDAVQEQDAEGNERPFGKSPARLFSQRVADKFIEQKWFEKNHMPLHLAPSVLKGLTVNYARPTYLVQCMGVGADGKRRADMRGVETPLYPAVFAIPNGAKSKFLQLLTARKDTTKPLSAANNRFGDVFSVDNGRTVLLDRFEGTPVTYDLSPHRDQTYPLDPEWAKTAWSPWDNLLYTPTVEEVIRALIELCEPELIDYAFRGSAWMKYIPEKYHGLADHIPEAVKVEQPQQQQGADQQQASRPVYSTPTGGPPPPSAPPQPPAPARPSFRGMAAPQRPMAPPEEEQGYVEDASGAAEQQPSEQADSLPPPPPPAHSAPPPAQRGIPPPPPPASAARSAPAAGGPGAVSREQRYASALNAAKEASARAAATQKAPPSGMPPPPRRPAPPPQQQ